MAFINQRMFYKDARGSVSLLFQAEKMKLGEKITNYSC